MLCYACALLLIFDCPTTAHAANTVLPGKSYTNYFHMQYGCEDIKLHIQMPWEGVYRGWTNEANVERDRLPVMVIFDNIQKLFGVLYVRTQSILTSIILHHTYLTFIHRIGHVFLKILFRLIAKELLHCIVVLICFWVNKHLVHLFIICLQF